MNLREKKKNEKKIRAGLSVTKKQTLGVYKPSPKRPLNLGRTSGNLNMNLELKFNPTRFDWLAGFRQKSLIFPCP